MERRLTRPAAPPSEAAHMEEPTLPPPALDRGDVSLIEWMLSLTPTARLEAAQDFADGMVELRNAREIGD